MEEFTVLVAALDGVDGVIVIVILAVLIFGGSAIPKLARNLGSAKNEFEKGLKASKPADDADATTPPSSKPSDTDTTS
ncbi:MAG: twin-arginine translocase TatA/TatE family subunit [Acidobacteria bacterium]|nr:twin-arginine translocase TatA/TatE family subunit [Acidobacteriota bacterium]